MRAERERLKQLELQLATEAVQQYQRYIDLITSVHKTSSPPVDWVSLAQRKPLALPERTRTREDAARHALATFKPSLVDRILGRTDGKMMSLKGGIRSAAAADDEDFRIRQERYDADLKAWKKTTELAKRVLRDGAAMLDVIKQKNPFSEIVGLGTEINFNVDETGMLSAKLNVHIDGIIPGEEFSLYSSGKLKSKKLNKSRYYELYQYYVCGAVLRVSRELCALLPIEFFIVTAEDKILNSATGKIELQPILSVHMQRSTLQSLNFERIDPSDAMRNFNHNMDFKATQGFKPVAIISVPRIAEVDEIGCGSTFR